MHLTRMRFGRIPPFTEPVDFCFDERVNVFVGANATGKSRLLSAIDEHFNKKEGIGDWHESSGGNIASFEPYPFDLLNLTLCQEESLLADWVKGRNALCADREWVEARFNSSDKPPPPVIYLA